MLGGGKGGNGGGGLGIPLSSGVSGLPLGGEMPPNSPSDTGEIVLSLSFVTTSSSMTCSKTSDLTGGGRGGVRGLGKFSVPGGGGVRGDISPLGLGGEFFSGVKGDMSPLNPGPGDEASVSF